jgi:hypothetical protein
VKEENELINDSSLQLLYGDCRWSIMSKRYIISVLDGISLAAIQMQVASGNFLASKFVTGYM